METRLNRNARWRVRLAFFFFFLSTIGLAVGAYFITQLRNVHEAVAAHETQTALQGVTDPKLIDEAARRDPSNKMLRMIAMASGAAIETSAAAEKLANEVEPPGVSSNTNLGAASRSDLEVLRRDLNTAEANATAFMPRYITLIKAEREKLQTFALSLHADKDIVDRFLEALDKRHAKATAFTSEMLSASADYYRAYGSYVDFLIGEFGAYKVVNGQFIFPLQRTVDRYNTAGHAMSVAAKRVAELEERRKLMQSQQEGWELLATSK